VMAYRLPMSEGSFMVSARPRQSPGRSYSGLGRD
jgi:hypothetical protein